MFLWHGSFTKLIFTVSASLLLQAAFWFGFTTITICQNKDETGLRAVARLLYLVEYLLNATLVIWS